MESNIHTQTTARRSQTHSERSLRAKIRRDDSYTWHIQTAQPQANAKPLREEDLPVSRSQTGHHHTEDSQNGAQDNEGSNVSSVVEGTRYHAH